MEKQTVFIKRYPKNGELPKVDNKEYLTDKGLLKFEGGNWFSWWQADQYTPAYPNFFLEEIELPSEDYLQDIAIKTTPFRTSFMACANFILNHLKSADGSIHTNEKGQEG